MNRYGIALAADSAVSIGDPDQPKIYNTINKLFSLSKRAPVGSMFYGTVLLTGVPWETVIKSFRQELGSKAFDTLIEYADALIEYIENTLALFSPEQEESEFRVHCIELYVSLWNQIEHRLHNLFEESGEVTPDEILAIVTAVFETELDELQSLERLEELPEGYGASLISKFADVVEMIRHHVFEDLPLDEIAVSSLNELTAVFIERPPISMESRAGLVVAGFGEKEFAPVLVDFEIYGVMDGRLRRRRRSSHEVADDNRAIVVPFAQREMVDLFMSGIDPSLQLVVDDALSTLIDALPDLVADAIPSITDESQESLRSGGSELLHVYRSDIQRQIQQDYVRPILGAVAALPKEELATMAETLVNLTSFKRRVTLDAETVGGAIDVAVISKGDGLIWIERKHYFDPTLNHHFFANYFHYDSSTQEDDDDSRPFAAG